MTSFNANSKWSYTFFPECMKRKDPEVPFQATFMLPSESEDEEVDRHTHEMRPSPKQPPASFGAHGQKKNAEVPKTHDHAEVTKKKALEVPPKDAQVLKGGNLPVVQPWNLNWNDKPPKPLQWEKLLDDDDDDDGGMMFNDEMCPMDDDEMMYMSQYKYTRPLTAAERREAGIGWAANVDVGGGNTVLMEQLDDVMEFVVCTMAYSPSQFYVVFSEHRDEVEDLVNKIQKCHLDWKPLKFQRLYDAQPIMALLLKPGTENPVKEWCRCAVIKITDTNTILVRAYDSGQQVEITNPSDIRLLPKWMKKVPAYAIRCKLRFKNNETLDDKCQRVDWTLQEKQLFAGLVYRKHLGIVVHGRNEYIEYEKVPKKNKDQKLDEYRHVRSDTGGRQDKFTWHVSASVLQPGRMSKDSEAAAAAMGLNYPTEFEPSYVVVVDDVADKFEEELKTRLGLCYPRVLRKTITKRRKSM